MPKTRQKSKPRQADVYDQINKLKDYRISRADEGIIRRYILILSDTAPTEQLIYAMAYVFRTTIAEVHRILEETTDAELCSIAVTRERWQKRSESRLGYISRRILE